MVVGQAIALRIEIGEKRRIGMLAGDTAAREDTFYFGTLRASGTSRWLSRFAAVSGAFRFLGSLLRQASRTGPELGERPWRRLRL
jgi:hypothetical protein